MNISMFSGEFLFFSVGNRDSAMHQAKPVSFVDRVAYAGDFHGKART